MTEQTPEQIAEDITASHLSPWYSHGAVKRAIAAAIQVEREQCDAALKRAKIAEADLRRGEQCTGHLRELAHANGWNGVENSKILHVFMADLVGRLQAENEGLRAALKDARKEVYGIYERLGRHNYESACSVIGLLIVAIDQALSTTAPTPQSERPDTNVGYTTEELGKLAIPFENSGASREVPTQPEQIYAARHQYATHKTYTGSGCVICGRPESEHPAKEAIRGSGE